MAELDTNELEKILGSTHSSDYSSFVKANDDSMIDMSNDFISEFKSHIASQGISQKELFTMADIPEGYGYKLLSGEKKTLKRDVILRIAIASRMDLKQTQRLIRKYNLPELYAKMKRDALIMMAINEHKSINETNALLHSNSLDILDRPGAKE